MVFAAGANQGSGVPRKDSVDRAAGMLAADAAERAGVRRFVQVSSMGAGQPPKAICAPGTWTGLPCAQAASPTRLPPAGFGLHPAGPRWHGPRADVAAVIAALLDDPDTRSAGDRRLGARRVTEYEVGHDGRPPTTTAGSACPTQATASQIFPGSGSGAEQTLCADVAEGSLIRFAHPCGCVPRFTLL